MNFETNSIRLVGWLVGCPIDKLRCSTDIQYLVMDYNQAHLVCIHGYRVMNYICGADETIVYHLYTCMMSISQKQHCRRTTYDIYLHEFKAMVLTIDISQTKRSSCKNIIYEILLLNSA